VSVCAIKEAQNPKTNRKIGNFFMETQFGNDFCNKIQRQREYMSNEYMSEDA
jgi:hypothetical protein